jgi:hypothetical protein
MKLVDKPLSKNDFIRLIMNRICVDMEKKVREEFGYFDGYSEYWQAKRKNT